MGCDVLTIRSSSLRAPCHDPSPNSDDVGSLGNLQNQLIASGFLSRPFDTSSWSEEEMAKLERCLNAMLSKAAVGQWANSPSDPCPAALRAAS